MRYFSALLLALLLCTMQSCFPTYGNITSDAFTELKAQNEVLKKQLSEKPKTITEKIVVTKEVTKVIEDTSKQMAWFKFIGILLTGVGVGALVCSYVWPFVKYFLKGIGAFAVGTGLTFFCLGLGTQIALPWLPYFLFIALCIAGMLGLVYLVRKIDWSKDESAAVKDLHDGIEGAKENPIIKAIVARAT